MSRITPEAQRSLPSWESRVSSRCEDQAMRVRGPWASPGSWDFWVVRAFLFACTGAVSYTLGPFGLRPFAAAGVGLLIASGVLLVELRLRRGGGRGPRGGGGGARRGGGCAGLEKRVRPRSGRS